VNDSTESHTSYSSLNSGSYYNSRNESPEFSDSTRLASVTTGYEQTPYQVPYVYRAMNAAQTYTSHAHHAYLGNPHPQTPVSGPPYSHYQQTAPLQPVISSYSPAHGQYHFPYGNSATPPQHHPHYPHQAQTTHLPAMAPPTSTSTAAEGPSYVQRSLDTTGQVAPPGVRPKITATLWEDEGTLCFQVEISGICVARREDNHMINGTKLLNVAQMTRGRRDGILKSEKIRNVVKVGPMHLKGVW